MKLKDWADKTGIKYLTAYRWFKAGKLPVPAYQSESGTIIVQDDAENPSEQAMAGNSNQNDAMSLFLKKTVEFSKNNSTVEDFAAFVISNFQLKLQGSDSPKYSKNKPKTEDIQKHFQKFLPDKESVDHLKNIKTLIKDSHPSSSEVDVNLTHDLNTFISMAAAGLEADTDELSETFNEGNIEGTVQRSVDLNSTPQQINYTGSISPALNTSSLAFSDSRTLTAADAGSQLYMASTVPAVGVASSPSSFRLSQKEIVELAGVGTKTMESFSKPRRRGRPSKKADK